MRWLSLIALVSFAPVAWAETPLPSFERQLGIQAWHEVNAKIEQAGRVLAHGTDHADGAQTKSEAHALLREAIAHAKRYESRVAETSGLAYLQGLCHRLLGEDAAAEAAYRRSIALDPTADDAWHDLGEMLIAQARYTEADEAFGHVTTIRTTGSQAWRGPLRQAEIAAHQHDPIGFEKHMREALRRGYRMQWVRDEPQWRVFFHDPALHDTVERLVRYYGSRELALELESNPP